jgi:predicted aspartyl protease
VIFKATTLIRSAGTVLLSLCLVPVGLTAQSAAHSAACVIDKSELTDADKAFTRHDYKKSVDLYAAALAKDPKDDRSHKLEIDSLLGQRKISDAAAKADSWTATDPKNAFAILAASDVRHDEGDWPEAYVLTLKAARLDPCLAAVYENLYKFEMAAGYRATAAKHIALAHQLAPNSPRTQLLWISTLPNAKRIQELKSYIQDDKLLSEKDRSSYELRLNKLAAQSENRCLLASSDGPARIPMVPLYADVGIRAWGLEVAFNGKKRVLQIDTGASGFALAASAGNNLGLPKIDTALVSGIGSEGTNGLTINQAKSVRIGNLEFSNCAVDILDKAGLFGGRNSSDIGGRLDAMDGLIGSDIFDHYLVTLDYIKHEVRLDPLPALPTANTSTASVDALGGSTDPRWLWVDRSIAPTMQSWTKIYRNDHELIIPTRLSSAEKPGRTRLFLIDTGADSNLIDVATANEITHSQDNDFLSMQGLSGKVNKVFETGKFTADFAGLRLPVNTMDALDMSKMGGFTGILGYPTLEQLILHIDYRDNLVSFEAPNGKRQ